MAGMKGFRHNCMTEKHCKEKNTFKNSIFSYAQIDMIWDLYVTHSICGTSKLERNICDYGWNNTNSKTNGYTAIERFLTEKAGLQDNLCFIRSKTCKDTLSAMDLANDKICINHPRAVLLQKYSISTDENEKINFSGDGENHITCLMRHIRNAFAHGNTYFFDNGFLLLEDCDGRTITAAILIKQETLIDWIKIIDKNGSYYEVDNACSSCKIDIN